MSRPTVAVCLKAVELRAAVDPLTGQVVADPTSLGLSAADEAALEWGLRSAAAYGARLLALSAGPVGSEAVLRQAKAAGADEVLRLDCERDWPSEWVAASLASRLDGAQLVWCGDMSFDRGSGSVPAFIAGELGAAQGLGLVEISLGEAPGRALGALRRLDGGRRERLSLRLPAVASVEGASARLRRGPLRRVIDAGQGEVPSAPGRKGSLPALEILGELAYSPPTRVVPPPVGDSGSARIAALLETAGRRGAAAARQLEPIEAARAILEALESWGEL